MCKAPYACLALGLIITAALSSNAAAGPLMKFDFTAAATASEVVLAHHRPWHKMTHWNRGRHLGWVRGKHKGWVKGRR